jgi:hypothetical protein
MIHAKIRLVVLVGLLGACSDGADADDGAQTLEPLGSVGSCSVATRDLRLSPYADQVAGAVSPLAYDNPGCDEGYVVEYDGTTNGVHIGYKLEDPRPNSTDGIQVQFPHYTTVSGKTCAGALQAGGYLYEKVGQSWVLREQHLADAFTPAAAGSGGFGGGFGGGGPGTGGGPGRGVACVFKTMTFTQVKKGTAAAPHVYRTALSVNVLDPNGFVGGAYPDGFGYGPFTQKACDVNNVCACGDFWHPCP